MTMEDPKTATRLRAVNGAGDGLVLVLQGGRSYVGHIEASPTGETLADVLEIHTNMQIVPQGLQIHHNALPLMALPSLSAMRLSPDATVVPLRDLSPSDGKKIRDAYGVGKQLAEKMRAVDLGIVMPGGGRGSPIAPPRA